MNAKNNITVKITMNTINGFSLLVAFLFFAGIAEAQTPSIANWSAPANVPEAINNQNDEYFNWPYLNHQIMLSRDGLTVLAAWTIYNCSEGGSPCNYIKSFSSVGTFVNNSISWGPVSEICRNCFPTYSLAANGKKAIAAWAEGEHWHEKLKSSVATLSANRISWSRPEALSTIDAVAGIKIHISESGDKATAIWIKSTAVVQSASATISETSAVWGRITSLSKELGVYDVKLDISADGHQAIAIWSGDDHTRYTSPNPPVTVLQSSSGIINGNKANWGNSQEISISNDQLHLSNLDMSMSPAGDSALAVWSSNPTEGNLVIGKSEIKSSNAKIKGNEASWSKPAAIHKMERAWIKNGLSLSISSNAPKALVVLQDYGGLASIYTGNYEGNKWMPIIRFAPPGSDPIVRLSSDGVVATAGWRITDENYQTQRVISASAYISDSNPIWSGATTLSAKIWPLQGYYLPPPQMALSADGKRAIASWVNFTIAGDTSTPPVLQYATATIDRPEAPPEPSPNYLMTVNKSAYGFVTSSPVGIDCGLTRKLCKGEFSAVSLTATPNPGYTLKKWIGCPAATGNTCSLTLTQKTTVGAVFAKLPKYALKIVKTKNGEITSDPAGLKCKATAKTCSASFVSGTRVRLTPNPLSGYRFVGWTGACTGTAACEVTMDAKKLVGAQFE